MRHAFRARAFRVALDTLGSKSMGAYVCTIGDRHDTDVMSYLEIRAPHKEMTRAEYAGVAIGRLRRGVYKDDMPQQGEEDADFTVSSLPEFVAKLSSPGFWRHEPTIRVEDLRAPQDAEPTADERKFLKSVKKKWRVELAPVIDSLLSTEGL